MASPQTILELFFLDEICAVCIAKRLHNLDMGTIFAHAREKGQHFRCLDYMLYTASVKEVYLPAATQIVGELPELYAKYHYVE